MTRAVVTGANGFIGRHLCAALHGDGWDVVALARQPPPADFPGTWLCIDDLAEAPETLFDGFSPSICFHLAGRAHRPAERGGDETPYRRDNVRATQRLAAAAIRAGVRRLVYLSSIKVLGDVAAEPLAPDAEPRPADAYGATKLAAEVALETTADRLPVTVVRPPLVHGPGMRGQLPRLIGWIRRGWPLPLGRADALRSVLGVANLCDLLLVLPGSTRDFEVLHARDPDDLTVAELVRACAAAAGRPARNLPVPAAVMRRALEAIGRRGDYERLFEPLRVDDRATRARYGWQPARSTADGLRAALAGPAS